MEMKWLLNYFSNFPRADPKEASFVIVESGCYLDRPPSIFELSSDVQPTAPPSPPKCQQKGSLAPSKQLVSHQGSSTHPYPHTTPSFSAPPHLFPGLSSRYFRPHTTQPSHPPRGSHRRTKWQTLRQRSILTRSSTVSWKVSWHASTSRKTERARGRDGQVLGGAVAGGRRGVDSLRAVIVGLLSRPLSHG